MKRSPIRNGAKSLERGSTFAPKGRVRRPLTTKHRAVIDRQASEAWAKGVRSKPCVRCGAWHAQGHHILSQQALRRRAKELGIDAQSILWDERNRLALCPRCHAAHHLYAKRITRAMLEQHAPKVAQFARELGLDWLLDRDYPPTTERAA